MSIFGSTDFNQVQHSDTVDDNNFENDDLVTFLHDSKTINFYYSQLIKYSKHIRGSYLFSDVINRLPQEMHKFQEEYQISSENIDYFFQLLQQNYNLKENSMLTYIQCIDLQKLSKLLKVRKLSYKINQYIQDHSIDVDFVIQIIEYENKMQERIENEQFKISQEVENLLSSRINDCLSNEKFKELPIEIIYRIIKQSIPKFIDNNKLFDLITKSLSKFCVLFQFLDLQKVSDDRIEELCEMYSKSDENAKQCFDYLKCNLNFIKEMNKNKKNLQETNDEQKNKMADLESKISLLQEQYNNSEKVSSELQNQLNDSKDLNNEQQSKMKELENQINQLQSKLNDSNEQQSKMKELENQINQLQSKLANSENEVNDIRKHLNLHLNVKGIIDASVENGLLINAEIKLKLKDATLDTENSKCIISTSDAKSLGKDAYEKGEPITSLHMKTTFLGKPGTYYVRCIVFISSGESIEIVSNSVTTNGSSVLFAYVGDSPSIVSLPRGQYKLEVWGAKGGDSTGNGYHRRGNSTVKGGLGGYSKGILNLKENKTVYVYVGEEGHSTDSSDGSTGKGGFPDGGGAKTGHFSSYTTAPGTGGGSTSIRIGSNSNYARVIVAGGGGGASGNSRWCETGGFGGGLSGGNCCYTGICRSQGSGTQTGSTQGLGEGGDRNGDPGQFGSGATGKYNRGCDSGGGGGGGWYGGGSGGFGDSDNCSSGGGGSGWTFTESSYKNW